MVKSPAKRTYSFYLWAMMNEHKEDSSLLLLSPKGKYKAGLKRPSHQSKSLRLGMASSSLFTNPIRIATRSKGRRSNYHPFTKLFDSESQGN